MNETFVTLSGWLGGDVTLREAGRRAGGHLPGRQHPASLPAPHRQLGGRRHPVVLRERLARPRRELRAARCAAATPWWCTASSAPTSGPTRPGSR